MPSTGELIVCGLFFFISFIICSLLLPRSLYDYCKKKHKMRSGIRRTVGLSLISMSLFTFSLFLYLVHFIIFVAVEIDVQPLELLNNLLYFIAVLTALYVWIRRLGDTFHNSSHGYSAKSMRNLRIFYFGTLALGLIILFQHFLAIIFQFTKMISIVGGGVFAVLFVSLFISVLYSFIHKMRQTIKLAEQVAQSTVNETRAIKPKLVQLIVKFTVLAVCCIASTLCSWILSVCFMGFAPSQFHGYWMQLSIAIDDLIGFMSLYCAWSNNKDMYRKVFGCVHTAIIQLREIEDSSVTAQGSNDATRPTAPSVVSVASQSRLNTAAAASPNSVPP
eukprot:201643_1